ncbi:hypothetical protein AJ87_44720 [Rhizobium yanglingense]|nr:hypothetical protein AJ87_44720 [Rhizobium yanglingense]
MPTLDVQYRSRREGIAYQEADGVGDIVRTSHTSDRQPICHCAQRVGLLVAGHKGPNGGATQPGETALTRIGANSIARARTSPSNAALTAATTAPRADGL